jgi:hypothetical protein
MAHYVLGPDGKHTLSAEIAAWSRQHKITFATRVTNQLLVLRLTSAHSSSFAAPKHRLRVHPLGIRQEPETRSDGFRRSGNTVFDGLADDPVVAWLPAHLDRRFRYYRNRGVLLQGQLERPLVLATAALVRVRFSIAVIPQRRHQGEPHGPGTSLTRHKWCGCTGGEWLQRHVIFLSSDRASERGLKV